MPAGFRRHAVGKTHRNVCHAEIRSVGKLEANHLREFFSGFPSTENHSNHLIFDWVNHRIKGERFIGTQCGAIIGVS